MSRPPPPPSFPGFPTPNVPRSSATGYAPPPGSVYPPQTSNRGIYPPQQAATYSTSQPHQPPHAHQTRDPYSAYSSSPPHPSAHLPVSGGPQAPSPIPIPSVPGGYGAPTNFSGAPPPPIMQRATTIPTQGQGHNLHSAPYHNIPAPVIAYQPSHAGMSEGTWPVTGNWTHHDQRSSHTEDLEQRLEAAGNSSDHMLDKSPPARPGAGRPPPDLPCMHCGRMTRRKVYDSLGGFCKERHRDEWYANQQNQYQYQAQYQPRR